MTTQYCQFCRKPFEDHGPARLGGRYFCTASHAMRFFKGEEHQPDENEAQKPPETPPFQRLGRPKLLAPV